MLAVFQRCPTPGVPLVLIVHLLRSRCTPSIGEPRLCVFAGEGGRASFCVSFCFYLVADFPAYVMTLRGAGLLTALSVGPLQSRPAALLPLAWTLQCFLLSCSTALLSGGTSKEQAIRLALDVVAVTGTLTCAAAWRPLPEAQRYVRKRGFHAMWGAGLLCDCISMNCAPWYMRVLGVAGVGWGGQGWCMDVAI